MRTILVPKYAKSWRFSRTVWVNLLTLVVSILGVVSASELLMEYPRAVTFITGIAMPVINVVLRFITDTPIVPQWSTAIQPRRESAVEPREVG